MSTDVQAQPAAGQSKRRSVGVWIVLVLAGILLLLSSFAVWIDRVALNSGVFTDTSSTLLEDRAIRNAIGTRAVDELFANVDVKAEVEGQLPKDYKGLSGAATAGLREASYRIVNRALEQPAFQRLFEVSLEETHRTLVEVLEGGGSRVSTQEGEVTLDLRDIIQEAAERIGIGDQVADRIPADAGRIVVLRADELDTAQDAFQLLKTLAWVLPILTLAAFGLAVWLAGDRRVAVRGIGITLAVVGAVGLVAANLTGNYVVDSLVARRDDREAADNAWDILTDLMRGSFRLMIFVGILFLVAAWLAGESRRAHTARGWLAPAFRNRAWAYVALALVTLYLLLSAEVAEFTRLLVVVILVALGATWIEVTRSRTLQEFPDTGGPSIVDDARERISDWWESRRREPAVSAAAPTHTAPTAATDLASRLAALADLHSSGELSDEEYAAAKARVLAGE
jgi:hypothetical protein